jgi:hypothetical protein
MAGFYLTRETHAAERLAMARDQFARHGFGEPQPLALPGWRGLHWPYAMGGVETIHRDGDDWVAVAGTLFFDGRMGREALARLLESWTPPSFDWSRVGGQFTAIIAKAGRAFVVTDWFAAHQCFRDELRSVFTTSLLAACRSVPRLSFDAQAVYEVAFNVVPVGDDTVFEQLKLVGPFAAVELLPDGTANHRIAKPLPVAVTREPLAGRIEAHRARLEQVVGAHVEPFGDRVFCPLSGGIDSRLLLAALRAAGSRPHVYVYGARDEDDVVVAKAIGEALGFGVEWVDKDGLAVAPDAFAARVETDFHEFDALPTFGNIFDNGGQAMARDARHAGGALAASGGCGEIWRDFFFLPDRPLAARDVAHAFFARFDPRDATDAFDARAFLERIAAKITDAIGADDPAHRLPRAQIEQAYPAIRCRSLFGREISLESRLSPYMMPFLDHRLVAEALRLPMALKQAGVFEAKLLTAIDPALAARPSAYGYSFDQPPTLRHRLTEAATRVRPIALRRRSYAIQRRMGRAMGDEHGGLIGREWLGRVLDLDFPAMRRFFRVDRIADPAVYRRIAALEYLARHLGSRIAG